MPSPPRKREVSTLLTPSDGARSNSRAALLEAALEEFTTKGYEAATLAGIADRAGVTTGAVYAHFAGKLDLLLATVGLTPVADLAASLEGSGRRPRPLTARTMARGLAERPDERRVLLLDAIVMARRDGQVAATLRKGLEAYVRASAAVIEAAGGEPRAASADAVSRLLAVINLGMTVFAALDAPTPPARSIERLMEALLPPPEAGDDGCPVPPALAELRAAAEARHRAEDELHARIVAAVDAGHSLRSVGAAAGLSHEAVRRIVRSRR